jgi:hypothetical protein
MPVALMNVDFVGMGAIAGGVDRVIIARTLCVFPAMHPAIQPPERDRVGGHHSFPNEFIQDRQIAPLFIDEDQPRPSRAKFIPSCH